MTCVMWRVGLDWGKCNHIGELFVIALDVLYRSGVVLDKVHYQYEKLYFVNWL